MYIFIFYTIFAIELNKVDMAYHKLYIQKTGSSSAYDTLKTFGVWAMEVPFHIAGDVKDLPSNDWKDESGEDEYLPDVLPMKAYDMTVKFGYKGERGTGREHLAAFFNYLRGKSWALNGTAHNGDGSEIMIYSELVGIGRRGIRLKSIKDEADYVLDDAMEAVMVEVTFKVNDPDTDVVLSDGRLVLK